MSLVKSKNKILTIDKLERIGWVVQCFFRHKHFSIKKLTGNSLGVQWLGLSTFTAMSHVQSTVGEIRSCKLSGTAKNNNNNLGLCFTSHDKMYFDRSWNKRKKWASIKRYALERIILFWSWGKKRWYQKIEKCLHNFFVLLIFKRLL